MQKRSSTDNYKHLKDNDRLDDEEPNLKSHNYFSSGANAKSTKFYSFEEETDLKEPLVEKPDIKDPGESLKWYFGFGVLTNYIISDMMKKPKAYVIGILTITITVAFFVIIYNILDVSPVIFLKLSQDQVGESDVIFHAAPPTKIAQNGDRFMYGNGLGRSPVETFYWPLINATDLQLQTEDSGFYQGMTPRWFGLFDFSNPKNTSRITPGIGAMIDTKNEVEIDLGRDFSKTILGSKQAFVTSSTLRYLGIKAGVGENIQMSVDISKFLNTDDLGTVRASPLFQTLTQSEPANSEKLSNVFQEIFTQQDILGRKFFTEGFRLYINFEVVEAFDRPNGKMPNSYGNLIIFDCQHILPNLIESLMNQVKEYSEDLSFQNRVEGLLIDLKDLQIQNFAMQVDAVIRDRERYYSGLSDSFNLEFLQKADRLDANVTLMTPVQESLEKFSYVQLFLESTLYTIVAFILILSAMLIYSLMISDIDEKTFEMAMLRALGLENKSLVHLILLQALVFSLPGLLIGLAIGGLANLGLRAFVGSYTVSKLSLLLSSNSILIAVIMGISMPIFTNLFTIQRALGKKITDSLDLFHTGASDAIVKIRKLGDYGISLFTVSLGGILVLMGVMTYYLAPAAFLFKRMEIFFSILNLVLIIMIIGMGLLFVLVFPIIQKVFIHILCF